MSDEPWEIDGEAGDYSCPDRPSQKLLRYQRYNLLLEQDWLYRELGVAASAEEIEHLAKLDRPESADRLFEFARQVAERQVQLAHLMETTSQ